MQLIPKGMPRGRVSARRHTAVLITTLLVCMLGISGATALGRNLISDVAQAAYAIDRFVTGEFTEASNFAEVLMMDSSLNELLIPQTLLDPTAAHNADFAKLSASFAERIANAMIASNDNTSIIDLPFVDVDNAERREFNATTLLRRKLHVWNETTRVSRPIMTVSRDRPLSVDAFRGQRRKYRLLCVTFTFAGNNAKAAALHKGWGRRCDRHMVVTNSSNGLGSELDGGLRNVIEFTPPGGESYKNLWQRTRGTLRYFKEQQDVQSRRRRGEAVVDARPNMLQGDEIILESYDFVFFGGDDVFIIPENMHKLFNSAPVEAMRGLGVPLHLGYSVVMEKHPRFIAGAGYVLDSAAVRLASTLTLSDTINCRPHEHIFKEDVYLTDCLQRSFGIFGFDTRDSFGEDIFHALNLEQMRLFAELKDQLRLRWWPMSRDRSSFRGLGAMSRDTVLIHYVSTPKDVAWLAEAIYGEALRL